MHLVAGLALLFTSTSPDLPPLREQLHKPAYASAFQTLFRQRRPASPWARRYVRGGDGTEGPGAVEERSGTGYELYKACQPHDCDRSSLVVMFDPGRGKAWALLAGRGKVVQFFGNPDPDTRAALVAFARRNNSLP